MGAHPSTPHPALSPEGRGNFVICALPREKELKLRAPHPALSPEGRGTFHLRSPQRKGTEASGPSPCPLPLGERGSTISTSRIGVTEGNRTLNPWSHSPVL